MTSFRTTHCDAGVADVPEHEGPQHRLWADLGSVAGRDELPPWLVGHAEGALVVTLVRHLSSIAGWYHLMHPRDGLGGTTSGMMSAGRSWRRHSRIEVQDA